MAENPKPLTTEEKNCYRTINKENLEFLMNRYNKTNRWVIADMIRRSAYHYPDKQALLFGNGCNTKKLRRLSCLRQVL